MYIITLEPKEFEVLKVCIENSVFVTELALIQKPKAEAIKTNLDFLKALEAKINSQNTAPNCQGQCGMCDGTCEQ